MVPAGKATDKRAKYFVVNDDRVTTLSEDICTMYSLLEMLNVFNLCAAAELSVAPTNSSPLLPPSDNSPSWSLR
jgi:hypothetical protein